jgi:hypothetical protein
MPTIEEDNPQEDNRSQSSNSWRMSGYNFHDQAPILKKTDIYYKTQTKPAGATSSPEAPTEDESDQLPVFSSWVLPKHFGKPTETSRKPPGFHSRPIPQPQKLRKPKTNVDRTLGVGAGTVIESNGDATVSTEYNITLEDETSKVEVKSVENDKGIPVAEAKKDHEIRLPETTTNWDHGSKSASSADNSSAQYNPRYSDRNLEGTFENKTTIIMKPSQDRELNQRKNLISRQLSLQGMRDQFTEHNPPILSTPKIPLVSSSSSSSLSSYTSSDADGFQDEYDDMKWYPSYWTIFVLIFANIVVAIGVGIGIYFMVDKKKEIEDEMNTSEAGTIPPSVQGDNIFANRIVFRR